MSYRIPTKMAAGVLDNDCGFRATVVTVTWRSSSRLSPIRSSVSDPASEFDQEGNGKDTRSRVAADSSQCRFGNLRTRVFITIPSQDLSKTNPFPGGFLETCVVHTVRDGKAVIDCTDRRFVKYQLCAMSG